MMAAQPDLTLSPAQFSRLAEIVRADTGIVLTEAKRGLLVARLSKRLRALRLTDFGAYCDRLNGHDGAEERRHLLTAITTNVTAFFREGHHFNALGQELQGALGARARAGDRIRLWSAACSSGEEPYSIAMTVLEALPEASGLDLLILATDIDPDMVARAEDGVYPAESVRPIGPARLRRFFDEQGDRFAAKPELRRIMRFAELNLHESWPFSGRFDVIFCRNVVIYFDAEGRQRLWQRFAEVMAPGGQLFIGHSERLDGPAARMFDPMGSTQYHRRASSSAAVAP